MPSDQAFLWEMLYQSLYVPEGSVAFERSILDLPEIAKYVKDWGCKKDDAGFVAVNKCEQPIGAIWLRLFQAEEKGFGYVDNRTPEIGMAVLVEYRCQGIGTSLLSYLLKWAAGVYQNVSLSVAAGNPARRLYERQGFEVVGKASGSVTMNRRLRAS